MIKQFARFGSGIGALSPSVKVLFLVRLINSMGNFVFPFLTMLLTVKLGYSEARAGAFMSAASLLAGLGMLAGGKIGDSLGRRRTIAALQVSSALLMLACALSGLRPSVPYLIAAAYVLLQASWPNFNALVADLTPADRRKEAFALLYWGNNIGFSIGPLMAGYLFNTHASWMFLGNAFSLLIVSSLLTFAVRPPQGAAEVPHPAAAGACRDEEAPEDCSLLSALLKRPQLLAFAVINLVLHFVYQQHLFGLPVFLNQILGNKGPSVYGMVMTTNGLTVVLCTAAVTALLARKRPAVNIALAAVFYALGFGMLYFTAGSAAVLVSTFIWTLGEIMSATNVQVFIAARTPSSHRGRMNAFIGWISGWGSTAAPLLSGAFIGAFGNRALWPAVAALSLGAALMLLAIARYDAVRRIDRRAEAA